MIDRRTLLKAAVPGLVALRTGLAGAEEAYPNKPVWLVVPLAPGGAGSIVAQLLSDGLTKSIGQSVLLDYKAGATGNIAANYVAKSPHDGYVLLLVHNALLAINPLVYRHMPFDGSKDLAPVSMLVTYPNILVVPKESPIRTVEDVKAAAKASAAPLSYASSGLGSTSQLAAELFARRLGIKMEHIPYKAAVTARQDVIGGRVSLMFTDPSGIPLIKDGRLRALGVSSTRRLEAIADVPTIAEQGLPGFNVEVVFGICAPAQTPPEIIRRLEAEIGKVMAQDDVKNKLQLAGIQVATDTHAQALRQRIQEEQALWAPVVKDLAITLD